MNILVIYTLLICFTLGAFILVNAYMDKNLNIIFIALLLLVILLLPITFFEEKYSTYHHFVIERELFSVLGYSIKPAIPYLLFLGLIRGRGFKGALWGVPIYINFVICSLSVPFTLVFDFTQKNQFIRGPLNFLSFAIGFLYIILIIVYSIKKFSNQRVGEIGICIWLAMLLVVSLFLEIRLDIEYLFASIVPISLIFYYMYLYTMNFKLDHLTGVYGRACFELEVKRIAKRRSCGILMVDINGLKKINDEKGHQAGDQVIRQVAESIEQTLPVTMKLYRIGGDEFIALWKNTTNAKMETFIEKFRTVMGKKDFSVSIGSDFYSNGNGTLEEAIKRADEEMYRDKKQRYGRQ